MLLYRVRIVRQLLEQREGMGESGRIGLGIVFVQLGHRVEGARIAEIELALEEYGRYRI